MCLIVFSYKAHKNYKLVVAANRDEFYERPTVKADFWSDHPQILGGRDLEAKGTWMGVTMEGRISMLTNYRDLRNLKENAPSRGNIVADFLKKAESPKSFLSKLDAVSHAYNGFNLVLGNSEDLWYYSNQTRRITMLGSGVYGLSNALLDTSWPKVKRAKEKIGKAIEKDIIDEEEILNLLFDDVAAPDEDLPDTGVGYEKEKMLSSVFIKSPNYGTRCSTVVTITNSGKIYFKERTYDLNTFNHSTQEFEFEMKK